jgi:hypothetical protein
MSFIYYTQTGFGLTPTEINERNRYNSPLSLSNKQFRSPVRVTSLDRKSIQNEAWRES